MQFESGICSRLRQDQEENRGGRANHDEKPVKRLVETRTAQVEEISRHIGSNDRLPGSGDAVKSISNWHL